MSRTRPPPYAWYVVAVLTLASVSGNIDQQILTLLVGPIERDLRLSDTQMGLLMGPAFAVFYALLGLPIAWLADRMSRRNIMAGGVALWSVFTAACAAAQTYGRLFLLRVGVGVGEATLFAPSVSLIADYFPRDRLSQAMGILSMSVFLGSGLAYFIGGAIIGLLSQQGVWVVPVIGAIRPWQTVFLAVGLPGLVVALLFLTVKETRVRAGPRGGSPAGEQRPGLRPYVRANRRTFALQSLGFAAVATVNYGIAAWLATFLVRTYRWDESTAGRVMGILTMTVGVLGAVAGGWLAGWFVKRGRVDGPIRVGIIATIGMLVSATALPLMPTAALAVAWLAVVNFFAALPWGPAAAAAAEIVPAHLRAQGVALYFFVLRLVSSTLGPTSVAFFTDRVFRDPSAVRYSLVLVNIIGMSLALVLLVSGLGPYRRTLAFRERLENETATKEGRR